MRSAKTFCPCCGKDTNVVRQFWVDEDGCAIYVDGVAINLTVTQAKMCRAIERIHPRTARHSYLVESLYSDDPEGGPVDADNVVKVYAWHIRKSLQNTSIKLETVWGSGYRFVEREDD